MKNIIIEDLERIKLLFNYDNKKTLSENINIISETSSLALELKNLLAGSAAHEVEAEINNILRKGTKLFDDAITPNELKTSTEVIDAIKAGKITQVELKKVTQGIINSTSNPNLSNKFITLLVNTNKYQDEFKNLTRAEAKSMLSSRGYTNPDAIMDVYSNGRGKFKSSLVSTNKPKNDAQDLSDAGVERMRQYWLKEEPESFKIFENKLELAGIKTTKDKGYFLGGFKDYHDWTPRQLQKELFDIKKQLTDQQWSRLKTFVGRFGLTDWTAAGVLSKATLIIAIQAAYGMIKGSNVVLKYLGADPVQDAKDAIKGVKSDGSKTKKSTKGALN